MNVNQVKALKESYMKEATRPDGRKSTTGEYMRFITDCNLEFVTSKDLVIMDDDKSIVHCVCLNEDVHSQANFPVKIISAPYEDIHAIEAIMSRDNFETFLNDGYFNNISDFSNEKKEFMLKWANNIKIQAQQLPRAVPFYTEQARVIPMPNLEHNRDDGITTINPYTSAASFNAKDNNDNSTSQEEDVTNNDNSASQEEDVTNN